MSINFEADPSRTNEADVVPETLTAQVEIIDGVEVWSVPPAIAEAQQAPSGWDALELWLKANPPQAYRPGDQEKFTRFR